MKSEPTAKAVSIDAVSELGIATGYKSEDLYEGRGFEAPQNKALTSHKSGTQGKH